MAIIKFSVVVCLALVGSLVPIVFGYGGGAPLSENVCNNMTPKHGVDPQTTPSPYTLSLDKTTVKPGQEVTYTITGNKVNFKGFLVQGRKIGANGPSAPIGKFNTLKNGGESQPLNCGDIVGSSITHTNPKDKSSITLKWVAPESKGTYQLLTTIVQAGDVFWVQQPSESINVV